MELIQSIYIYTINTQTHKSILGVSQECMANKKTSVLRKNTLIVLAKVGRNNILTQHWGYAN